MDFPAVAIPVESAICPSSGSLLSALNLAVTSRKSLPCDNDQILVERLLQAWRSGDGRDSSGTPWQIRRSWVTGYITDTEIKMRRINREAVLYKDE